MMRYKTKIENIIEEEFYLIMGNVVISYIMDKGIENVKEILNDATKEEPVEEEKFEVIDNIDLNDLGNQLDVNIEDINDNKQDLESGFNNEVITSDEKKIEESKDKEDEKVEVIDNVRVGVTKTIRKVGRPRKNPEGTVAELRKRKKSATATK